MDTSHNDSLPHLTTLNLTFSELKQKKYKKSAEIENMGHDAVAIMKPGSSTEMTSAIEPRKKGKIGEIPNLDSRSGRSNAHFGFYKCTATAR